MENRTKRFLIAIIVVVFFSGFFSAQGLARKPVRAEAQGLTQTGEEHLRTLSVSGMGTIQAQPDLAIVQLGVETQAETAQAALDENNTKTQAMMDTLDGAGIPSENIQTHSFQLAPNYNYDQETGTQTLIGYSVSNLIQIETENLDTLGVLLDLAVDAGANTIQSIRFEVSDIEHLASQARQAAVENARAKAEQLAALTGASLGLVLSIQESSNLPGPIAQQTSFAALAAEAPEVPIEPGKYQVQVSVNITWLLNDSSVDNPDNP